MSVWAHRPQVEYNNASSGENNTESFDPPYGYCGELARCDNCSDTCFIVEEDALLPMAIPIHGYISPFVVAVTIITNTLVCIVLLKRNMLNPTNSLLAAMAISDMLTGIWPIPCFIYFFSLGFHQDYIPFNWCYIYSTLVFNVPTVFHTASIWLTVALAVQRYIYVCHSLKAKRWCTIRNVVKGVFIIYFVSILTHSGSFIEREFIPVDMPSKLYPDRNVTTCLIRLSPLIDAYQYVYFTTYTFIRIIFIHLVPCASLVVLNALLIHAMRTAQARRKQLLKQNRNSESRKLKESNCTTCMLVAVVGVFLIVEFPLGVLLVIMILENSHQLTIMAPGSTPKATLVINFFILLSYPINFFIYCGMSRQFRETFKRLLVPGKAPLDREHSHYISLATENGAKTLPTNETAM